MVSNEKEQIEKTPPDTLTRQESPTHVTAGQTGLPWLAHPPTQPNPPPNLKAIPPLSLTRTFPKHIYSMSSGLCPTQPLLTRLRHWQLTLTHLTHLFQSIRKTESNLVHRYRKIELASTFPLNDQFRSSGGVQDGWRAFQHYCQETSLVHQDFVDLIESDLLPRLRSISTDLCQMAKTIKADKGFRTHSLWSKRKRADKAITTLNNQIYQVEKNPSRLASSRKDPLLTSYLVIQTIKELYREENKLHKAYLDLQDQFCEFEHQKIISACRDLFQVLDVYRIEHRLERLEYATRIAAVFDAIEKDAEWKDFREKHSHELIHPLAAYKDETSLDFPNHDHSLVRPLISTVLQTYQRKKWSDYFYVLSPVGYLYRYKDQQTFLQTPLKPELKLFIPQSTIFIHPTHLLFQVTGKSARGLLYKARLELKLSASTVNLNKRLVEIIAALASQQEIKSIKVSTPPSVKSVEPILKAPSVNAIEPTPSINPIEPLDNLTSLNPIEPTLSVKEIEPTLSVKEIELTPVSSDSVSAHRTPILSEQN